MLAKPEFRLVGPERRRRHYIETALALCNTLDHDLTAVVEGAGRKIPEVRALAIQVQLRLLEIQDVVSAGWSSGEQANRPLSTTEYEETTA